MVKHMSYHKFYGHKGKVQVGDPKSCRSRSWELFISKFKSQFKLGFAKVVVIRAGRLLEWSEGKLRLYINTYNIAHIVRVVYKWTV